MTQYLAVYAFNGNGVGELRHVKKGDVVIITDKASDPDWWTGYRYVDGPSHAGYVPALYLTPIDHQPRPAALSTHTKALPPQQPAPSESAEGPTSPSHPHHHHHPASEAASPNPRHQHQPPLSTIRSPLNSPPKPPQQLVPGVSLTPLKALKAEQSISAVLTQAASGAIEQIEAVLDDLMRESQECLSIPFRPPGAMPGPGKNRGAAVELMQRLEVQATSRADGPPLSARRVSWEAFSRELERFVDEEANRRLGHHHPPGPGGPGRAGGPGGISKSQAPQGGMFPAPTNSLLHHNSAPVLGGQRPGMAKPQQHQQGGGGGGIGRSNRGPAMQQGGGGGVGVLTVSGSHKRGRNNSNSARSPLGPSSSVVNSGRLQEDPDLQSLIHQYSEELSFLFRSYRDKCEVQGPLSPGISPEVYVRFCIDFGVCSNMITRKRALAIHKQLCTATTSSIVGGPGGQMWLKEQTFAWALVACGIEAYGHVPLMEDYEKAEVFFTHLGLKDARSLRKWVTQQLQQGSRREGVQVGSTRMHMR